MRVQVRSLQEKNTTRVLPWRQGQTRWSKGGNRRRGQRPWKTSESLKYLNKKWQPSSAASVVSMVSKFNTSKVGFGVFRSSSDVPSHARWKLAPTFCQQPGIGNPSGPCPTRKTRKQPWQRKRGGPSIKEEESNTNDQRVTGLKPEATLPR